MEVLEYIDRMLRLFDELIEIPPHIVVFSRVDYFACIRYFQALPLWQCSLRSNLFLIKCKPTRAFADPVTDVDIATIAFFLQRLLVSFEPLASWAVICADNALVLWNKHMLFLTRSEGWQDWFHGFVVILAHKSGFGRTVVGKCISVSKYHKYIPLIFGNLFQIFLACFNNVWTLMPIMVNPFLDIFTRVTQLFKPVN